ncbi:MAG: hypothetical protein A3H96_05705 [Acidobacteria bacterium RIFCSPLOWO2_02_FULL_67_36]|nr:MAG: hypothetical protein A3H96_05705 [Acidobacteria bacterium RIFCSPLOWO2_02_FULL_67_36]OFW19750.1 MAG: hypothetical protein A3G21_13285 [Acidobacteria bacterium RIFCSPLOWO2_12_FULL_66_21]
MPHIIEHRHGPDRRHQPRGGRRPEDRPGYAPLVLLVGDDAEVKDQSEAILAKLRFAVATSTTAEEALRVLPALRPDLVIAPEGDVSRLRDEGPANLRVMVMNRDMEESPEELIAEVLRSVRRR